MRFLFFTLCICLFSIPNVQAQISPPGLGETNSASWWAIGVKQKLDEKNTLTTYIGNGRISGPEESDPYGYPSIWVMNAELSHSLRKNWKYNAALSYRRQNEYEDTYNDPLFIKQEFRVYGRISHTMPLNRFKWTNTFREEVRKFYDAGFGAVANDWQLRTRIKTQLFYSLDHDNEHSLMASAEALFSIANDNTEGWDNPKYKEARFCFYYTFAPKNLDMTFDIGYMNNLIGTGNAVEDGSYVAVDIVIENPF